MLNPDRLNYISPRKWEIFKLSRSGSNKFISNYRGALAGSVAKQMKKCTAYFFREAGEATAQLRFPAGVERKFSPPGLLKVMVETFFLEFQKYKCLKCMTLAAGFSFLFACPKRNKKDPAKRLHPV